MKTCVLLGNTRVKINTESLTKIFADKLTALKAEVVWISLRDKHVGPCIGCDKCHKVTDSYGCAINDDMREIAREILSSDLIVLSSPIYTWMPTPPLKAATDRLYAFTKHPENGETFNLLQGKKLAMIATSGDECETNCDLFNEAVRRIADFAHIPYLGYLAARDLGDGNIARPEVVAEARAFAKKCVDTFSNI